MAGPPFGGRGARGGGLELEFQLEFDSVEVLEFGLGGWAVHYKGREIRTFPGQMFSFALFLAMHRFCGLVRRRRTRRRPRSKFGTRPMSRLVYLRGPPRWCRFLRLEPCCLLSFRGLVRSSGLARSFRQSHSGYATSCTPQPHHSMAPQSCKVQSVSPPHSFTKIRMQTFHRNREVKEKHF